ncbi:Prp18 [Penicillium expansum]|uniref:Pre-mRNA-splicing factor 18 n=1 Tax=Penicillium expansum TaxID=27334 RepID=A0A0A2JW11_PENEN|nr:Prp18 [Penicillium expansum]KGO40659.1 Prp18 [Penicillium expansum]KGO59627.1 Prp18 [Penicillium expansum]KGO63357.1 Prp18 [Penicillium expansum]
MDFAALMSKEISKVKGADSSKPSAKDTGKSSPAVPAKKYMRRGDVEAARIEAYNQEQERLAREREERMANKRKLEDEEAERNREREEKKRRLAEESKTRREEEELAKERERRQRLGLPELPANTPGDGDAEEDIEEEELKAKLREMNAPIQLFGEDYRARLRRYRRLVQRAAIPKKKVTDGPIPTTLEPVSGGQMIIPAKIPKDQENRLFLFRQLGSYFNMVLSEWELALAKRDVSVRESFQGKQAFNAMTQSRENMTPLFRLFEKSDLEDGLLEPIVEIVHKAQQRRYVDANDAYLRVSIGKAAWPIGVTMVGIHERSAREKLHQSDQQAHILSDEITRKYLQSIKRCLSFAQVRWPPEDQLQMMG